jgi:hypothetical protein
MPLWNFTDTQFPIDSKQATYINPAYNKKLSTITATNPTGFVPVDANNSDPIVKTLQYAVRTDNKVVFGRPQTGTTGGITQYNTAQELANAGISGYTGATTDKLKAAMQKNLSTSAKAAGVGPATAPTPENPSPNSDPNSANPTDPNATSNTYDPNESIGSRLNNYDKGTLLVYPVNRKGIGGDYIQFQILKYKKSGLDAPGNVPVIGTRSNVALVGMEYRENETLATICLPIQSGIVDSMSVNWGDGELNPITAAFANVAYSQISSAGSADPAKFFGAAVSNINDIGAKFSAADPELRKMMINYFTEKAVGQSGLLSRTIGGALNNNLELLFNGPMLRSFTFNFRLTPREPKEAEVIKNIIRYFKKSMAPALSQSQLFLLAPNVFKIRYIYTGKGNQAENHPYLNRIKVAALRDFSVNYTPDGNYMTYGVDGSMTQYDLSMSFGEIDPIYENDYEQGDGLEGMGW